MNTFDKQEVLSYHENALVVVRPPSDMATIRSTLIQLPSHPPIRHYDVALFASTSRLRRRLVLDVIYKKVNTRKKREFQSTISFQ